MSELLDRPESLFEKEEEKETRIVPGITELFTERLKNAESLYDEAEASMAAIKAQYGALKEKLPLLEETVASLETQGRDAAVVRTHLEAVKKAMGEALDAHDDAIESAEDAADYHERLMAVWKEFASGINATGGEA